MQHEFGDDEHFDDDELMFCSECGSNNLDVVDAGGVDILCCQDCGTVIQD